MSTFADNWTDRETRRVGAPVLTRANTAFPTSRESHGGRCRTLWALLGGRRTRNAPPCPNGSKSRRDFLFKMSRCADVGFQRHCAARLATGVEFACEVSAVGDADRGQAVRNMASSSHRNACSHRHLHVETWPVVSNCRSTRHLRVGASQPTCTTAMRLRGLRCPRAKDRLHAGIAQDPVLYGRVLDLTSTARADFTLSGGARRGQRPRSAFLCAHAGRTWCAIRSPQHCHSGILVSFAASP